MTCYSFSQLEDIWTSNGGSSLYAPMAAAIAMAESGGCSDRISSSGDYGLWQINKAANGALATLDTNGNARSAIQISNNGTNWHPWCTAYSNGACGPGGFMGPGSPYQKFLSGSQITAGNSQISTGTTASQTTSGTATQTVATNGCIDQQGPNCQIPVSPQLALGPFHQTFGCGCIWKYSWSRVVIGGFMFAGAFALSIAGFFLITQQSKTVQQAMSQVGGMVKKGAKVGALVA